ncbi:MAG: hypothetical protein IJC97_00190 [Oscillospiraceae bacterium]|nr:hypothetical protein [Oscillospiraceae bacterium]
MNRHKYDKEHPRQTLHDVENAVSIGVGVETYMKTGSKKAATVAGADGELCVCLTIASKQRLDPAGINIAYPTNPAVLRKEYKI